MAQCAQKHARLRRVDLVQNLSEKQTQKKCTGWQLDKIQGGNMKTICHMAHLHGAEKDYLESFRCHRVWPPPQAPEALPAYEQSWIRLSDKGWRSNFVNSHFYASVILEIFTRQCESCGESTFQKRMRLSVPPINKQFKNKVNIDRGWRQNVHKGEVIENFAGENL